jgi:phosphoserine phosphatase
MITHSLDQIKEKIQFTLGNFNEHANVLFDLDGTMVMNDTSEAVYAYLVKNGYDIRYTWKEYQQEVLDGEINSAYSKMITCLNGIEYFIVEHASIEVMNSHGVPISFIQDGKEFSIPTPKIYQPILSLIKFFESLEIAPIVISASSDVSVKIIAEQFFGINRSRAHGVAVAKSRNPAGNLQFTDEIISPYPILEGKAQIYRSNYKETPVAFAAGDSINDKYLLDLVDEYGSVLLVGPDFGILHQISNAIRNTHPILFDPNLV